jgi:hypothetical protein
MLDIPISHPNDLFCPKVVMDHLFLSGIEKLQIYHIRLEIERAEELGIGFLA